MPDKERVAGKPEIAPHDTVEVLVIGDLSSLSTEPFDFKGKTNVRRKAIQNFGKGKKQKQPRREKGKDVNQG